MKVNNNLVDIYRKDTIEPSKMEQEFIKWFDSYTVNPMLSYFSLQDIQYLNKLAKSAAMNCNVKEKYRLMGELMEARGFKLIGGGTNRRAYECIYDKRIVAKVATDNVGFTSNLRELVNQNVLKPFCNKIFEVSPCGTLAIIEKVVPIKSVQEFQKYSQDIYDILYFKIRNNSIGMEDIGTRSFKNWGYRNGFGPVLLDYPTMYVLDPNRRLCRNIVNGQMCGGTLDYDEGFNVILCSECGRTHFARTLAKEQGEEITNLLQAVGYQRKQQIKKERINMRVEWVDVETKEVLSVVDTGADKTRNINPNRRRRFEPQLIDYNSQSAIEAPKKRRAPRVEFVTVGMSDGSEVVEQQAPVIPEPVVEENPIPVEVSIPKAPQNKPRVEFVEVESVVTDPVINKAVNDRKGTPTLQELSDVYNKYLTREIANTVNVSSEEDLIRYVKHMMVNGTYDIFDDTSAFSLYRRISMATLIDEAYIDDETVGRAEDTMVNKMLYNLVPEASDMFQVFKTLINNVANTADMYTCVIALFNSMLATMSFFTDEAPGGDETYQIYKDIYDIYAEAVEKIFANYTLQVRFADPRKPAYDRSNTINILNLAMSEMRAKSENYMGDLDMNNIVQIQLGNSYADQQIIELDNNSVDYSPIPDEEDNHAVIEDLETVGLNNDDTNNDDDLNLDLDITTPVEEVIPEVVEEESKPATIIGMDSTFLYGGANTNKSISRKQAFKYAQGGKPRKKGKKRRR